MFKAFTVYKLLSRVSLAKMEDALAAAAFEPCGASQEKSVGWQPPREQEHGAFVESVDGQYIARLMIETKSVPPAAVKQAVKEQLAEIEAQTGRKPGKRERREISEEVRLSLLPHAFPKQCAVTVWIDPRAGYLVIDNTSQSRLDEVVTALVRVIDGLQVSLINTHTSPSAWMALILADSDNVDSRFAIDRECELKAADESKAVVKYAKHSLDIKEVRDHIKLGKVPTKLALTWNDRVSFVLTENLQFKKIAFLDSVFEGGSKADGEDNFDADVAIVTGELRVLIPDLLDALGGESTVGSGGSEGEDDDL